MKILLLYIVTILASSLLTVCEGQTKLPKELPPNAEIIYASAGGLLPSFFQINIDGSLMTVSDAPAGGQQNVWQAKLSDADLKNLYQSFVENKFDSIRPNKEVAVADGKYRSIELKFGETRFYAVRGDGIETTKTDGERFNKVEDAFTDFVNKYKK